MRIGWKDRYANQVHIWLSVSLSSLFWCRRKAAATSLCARADRRAPSRETKEWRRRHSQFLFAFLPRHIRYFSIRDISLIFQTIASQIYPPPPLTEPISVHRVAACHTYRRRRIKEREREHIITGPVWTLHSPYIHFVRRVPNNRERTRWLLWIANVYLWQRLDRLYIYTHFSLRLLPTSTLNPPSFRRTSDLWGQTDVLRVMTA